MIFVVFLVDNQHFGLEVHYVNRVIWAAEVENITHNSHETKGAINIAGELIPVISVRSLLGKNEKNLDTMDQFILCQLEDKQVALWVDEVLEIKEADQSELTPVSGIENITYAIRQKNYHIYVYDWLKLIHSKLPNGL